MGPASWHQVDKGKAQLPAAIVRCHHKMALLKVTLSASGGVLVPVSLAQFPAELQCGPLVGL